MNNSQSTAGSTSTQYGTTQNPQTPGGQALANAVGNLQTVTTPNLFSGTDSVSITSVGDSSFSPYTSENTTTASVSPAPQPVNHHYPVIIASGVLVVIVIIASWLMTRRHSSY